MSTVAHHLESLYAKSQLAPSPELIAAIHTACTDGSITKLSLSSFLDRHIKELSGTCDVLCGRQEDLTSEEKDRLALLGQLLASNIILLFETRSQSAMRSCLLAFLDYASHCISSRYDFVGTAARIMSYDIRDLGYGWTDVENYRSMDFLAFKICNQMTFDTDSGQRYEYTGAGKVVIEDGILKILSSPVAEQGSVAFRLCDGSVEVRTRNTRDEKLKPCDSRNAESLESFAHTFLMIQKESGRAVRAQSGQEFRVGDAVTLKIREVIPGEDGHNQLICEILESRDCLKGAVRNEELVIGLYTHDLIDNDFICDGDCFPDAVIASIDEDGISFSIRDSYSRFAKSRAKEDHRNGARFKAKLLKTSDRYRRMYWMTPRGYGAISHMIDGVDIGDILTMEVDCLQSVKQDLYINIREPKYGYDAIDFDWDENRCLEDYVLDIRDAVARAKAVENDRSDEERLKMPVRRFADILSASGSEDSVDRYRQTLCSQFLSYLIRDDTAAAAEKADYLKCCIEYAQTGRITYRNRDVTHTGEQKKILDCLSLSGKEGAIYDIASLIDRDGLESIGNQVVSLILTGNLSSTFADEFKLSANKLRKKVCRLLGVADQYREKQNEVRGKYGKGENHNREFKSSYVFRNDKKNENVADIDYQGRGQVFGAVCAFLNADGGEVYIGVNDRTGDPLISEDYGLKADIRWLTENFDTLKMTRSKLLGHGIPKADSLDHLALFLNTEKELYFSETLQDNIVIEVTEDQDAIRIKVSPSGFEIAYLYKNSKIRSGGVAYKRDGHSTLPMSEHDKRIRMMSLMDISKTARFAVLIQDAINNRNRLIFRNYASGNSGTRQDRHVLPVNLFYNNENVYCWDIDKNDMREFRLTRIESIDVDGVQNRIGRELTPGKADVFRWVYKGTPKHIKLRMDVGALNYLLEEYSSAKYLPKEELYEESPNKWILDTRLQDFGAVRRFYLGLADKIEILDTEDSEALKADIRRFVKEQLSDIGG